MGSCAGRMHNKKSGFRIDFSFSNKRETMNSSGAEACEEEVKQIYQMKILDIELRSANINAKKMFKVPIISLKDNCLYLRRTRNLK
jgi:hypothetical protein